MWDRVSFRERGNSMTSFERSRKEEKNYMKPVQIGSVPSHVTKSAP